VVGLVILLSPAAHSLMGQARAGQGTQLVLTGGTIYTAPTKPPVLNGVVVIRDGKIAAVGRRGSVRIPRGVPTLDCSGLVITAGFWNSHVHFFERKWAGASNIPTPELAGQLQDMLTRYGFTSVFDLGSSGGNTRGIRERVESGEIPGPRIRSTGEALLGKGWMPAPAILGVLGVMPFPSPEVTNATETLAAARKLLENGSDGLKLFAAAPFPPFETLPGDAIRAAVEEAHRGNKLVFSHPSSPGGVLAAVRGGVDIIVHTTPQSGPWDEALVAEMRRANVALIPTLKIWTYQMRYDRASLGEAVAQTSTGQLRAWLAAGGAVLFGTDVGGTDDYDPTDEYLLMARAGMTFRQILAGSQRLRRRDSAIRRAWDVSRRVWPPILSC
jgi:imidazolonepropionase-like amidohydrolase